MLNVLCALFHFVLTRAQEVVAAHSFHFTAEETEA